MLKCQEGGHLDARTCANKWSDSLRYCPNENVTCQPEGYTGFANARNHEFPLIGGSKLSESDALEIMERSYKGWQDHGNVFPTALNYSIPDPRMFVCPSRDVTIWDFEHHDNHENGNFPCGCGLNWWSNETRDLLKYMSLDKDSADYNTKTAVDLLIRTCEKVSRLFSCDRL